MSRLCRLQSSDFSARLRHYLQSEEIIHADYQGSFSSQFSVLRLHWIKITGTCHLLAHRGREVGISVSRAPPDFHSDTETHSSLTDSESQEYPNTLTKPNQMLSPKCSSSINECI